MAELGCDGVERGAALLARALLELRGEPDHAVLGVYQWALEELMVDINARQGGAGGSRARH